MGGRGWILRDSITSVSHALRRRSSAADARSVSQRELAGMWQSRKAVPEQQLTVQAQVGVARKQRRLRELKGIRHRHFGEDGQVGNGRVMRQATLVVPRARALIR